MSGVSGLPASAEALGCQPPPPPPGSPPQLLPLPPSGLRDGRSPGPGPPKSDGRAQVAGIMGLLRPLQGLQPETRTFVGTASCEASPQTFQLWRKRSKEPVDLRCLLAPHPGSATHWGAPRPCSSEETPPLGLLSHRRLPSQARPP